ncbi:MAG: recombinase family protein [Promethearchaeota archaeon]
MNLDDPQRHENTCLIYWRVSTTIQRDNLKRQCSRLEAYTVANRFFIKNAYVDIANGINFKRKGLLKLLK